MSPLRILLVEDDPADAELVREVLSTERVICELIGVQTRGEFMAALETGKIDLILADYKLPLFDGLSALELAQERRPDLPFIFVSGTLGEETAIEALKRGATDYVLKSRLSRLAPSVQRALREAKERAERKKAEEALRLSEMYLAEAQRLSHIGSFGWDVASGEIHWSDETYRIFELEHSIRPTFQLVIERTHPDDRVRVQEAIDRASKEGDSFTVEHRLAVPDGRIKYLQTVVHRVTRADAERSVFLGAVSDITEHKRAERERQTMRQLEQEIARISRVSMMGELAASLAHEIKQPVAAVITSAEACLRFMQCDPADMEEAGQAIFRIIDAAQRATQIIDRNRGLFGQAKPQLEELDLNDVISETAALLREVASHHSISIRSDLEPSLPKVQVDRVQLQQVLMNLLLNGIEAMKEVSGTLGITSKRNDYGQLLVSVTDFRPGASRRGTRTRF